ncbi:chitinase [Kitasatospora sp. NBC_01250]|uniref:chitinase n=1 Tax=Kitasatospora sp. NBC_01250 TaxID=2903571 RepID=UPI002E33503A|nr:glycosyl hydrolase family 18 protein [Kitasatospora sp. NBC_01250]
MASVAALALAVSGAVLITTGGSANADTINLLQNPGFETGNLGSWSCTANSGAVVTSPVHSGKYALQATPVGSDDAQCSQQVLVQPGSAYSLSGWVQGSYVYLGASGTGTTDPSTWSTNSAWNQLSTSFTTGPSTTSVTVYLHGWYGTGAYQADDLVLSGPGVFPTSTVSTTGQPTGSPTLTSSPQPSTAPPTTAPPVSTSPTTTSTPTGPGGGNHHLLTGYWQDFDNGATDQRIGDVNPAYDIIAVAFADADPANPGGITFGLDPTLAGKLGGYTDAQFKADIAAEHAAGKKVVLSVGGQNGTISVADSTSAANFATSAYALIQQYGFDGVDIDLENGVTATYMSQALHSLAAKVGSGFVLTMAPQTIDMQSTGTQYFQLALDTKDILTVVNTQYYNSGSMNGCDGNVYSEGTEDFLTALACIQLQGGLAPSQVGLGVPASTSAAGSGYLSPATVDNALDCLAKGTNCGSFKPPATWPGIGGAMTWSTNWDASNGNSIATAVGGHLHQMS